MKLAVVEWVDSIGGNAWVGLTDTRREELPSIFSVGWVLEKTKDSIHLVSSVCPGLAKSGQDMNIPIGCIKRILYADRSFTIRWTGQDHSFTTPGRPDRQSNNRQGKRKGRSKH